MVKEKDKAIDPLLDDESSKTPDKPAPKEVPAVEKDKAQAKEAPAPPTPAEEVKTPEPVATPEPPIVAEKVVKPVSVKEAKEVDIIAQTKAILAKGPHTNFIIPLGENEAVGSVDTVQINGYKLTIQKGVMVNIPVPAANILAEKYRIAMTAGQDKKIDRASDVQDALS